MTVLYVAGILLSAGTGYLPLFLFAAISYLLGFAVVQLTMPPLGPLHAAIVAEADAWMRDRFGTRRRGRAMRSVTEAQIG